MKHFILFLTVGLFLFSCSNNKTEDQDTSEIKYSEEIAQVISGVTAGTINPNQKVAITFNEAIVESTALNQDFENPFTFSPSIKGRAYWSSTSQLVFEPSVPLQIRTNYTGKVDLTALPKSLGIDEIDIKFYVNGPEVVSFKGDLELVNASNPKELVYRGKVSFSDKIALDQIEKGASLEGYALSWNQETEKSFSFMSSPITRQESKKTYRFIIDRKTLNLPESVEKVVEVTPLKMMSLTAVEKNEDGKSPKVMLKFSDQLDQKQNLDGFVSIEPSIKFKAQKLGKYLSLDGDFRFGTSYQVTISSGLKSKWGTKTQEKITRKVTFSDIQPQVQFMSNGIFLPTSNEKKLQFMTTNLKRVHVEVKKIFSENIDNFFGRESLKSSKDRNTEFSQSYISTVGAIVYNQTFEISEERNQWLIHNLDLSNVLSEFSNGLYLIRLNFNPHDILVPIEDNELAYIQKNGQIFKPVTISDIGIIAKQYGNDKINIYTTDLKTGKPLPGVKITSSRYGSSKRGTTNEEGKLTLNGSRNSFIRAEKNGQISIIKPYEMQWNTSGFDVGGISSYDLKTRGFIYTERGVYRPGDSVNLSCIVRYQNSSPSNVPATFKLYNPEGTLVEEQTQKGAKDGFYNFNFGTDMNAPTGNWSAQVIVGNKYFYHTLKVETVVANRLKVKVTPALKTLLPSNKRLELDVEAKYLFGASAAGLAYEAEVEVYDVANAFPKFKEYSFFNQYVDFRNIKSKINSGRLNDDGIAKVTWNVPNLSQAPSMLRAKINASAQEEGGRPNNGWTFVNIHPFTHYVGLNDNNRYVKLNSKNDIQAVVVNHEGEAVAGRELVYRIYRNDSYWWYQYDSYRNFKMRFKTDKHSYLVEEGSVTSEKPYANIPFQPSLQGQYLIEVQDAVTNGHVSSFFMSAYPYGGIPNGDQNSGSLILKAEKETYEVGEEAVISFPSPKQGGILLTVEKGNQIAMSKWIEPSDKEDMKVRLKITKSMVPNAYITITALQTHAQTVNDRPIRMFGILPINVIDPETKQEIAINMPEELEPKQNFDINISTLNGKKTQFTIAVVDEGLLDLTNFKTPNPWKEFFKKIRLEVQTYDLFGQVIGANQDDVFKTFSIGGDMDYRESQVDPFKKKKRFKPVCLFQGPMETDTNGKAKVNFTMPNYVGSVRVMVVAAKGDTYSSAEKTVPVRSDLIVQPTIPRALKPGDEFDIPVNLFATKDGIGDVELTLSTEGPLSIIGEATKSHTFDKEGDQMFYFKVRVKEAIGQSKITFRATNKGAESVFDADVPVSPSAARIYEKEEKTIKPGESITFNIPELGLDGTNNARLHLAVFPNMDFLHRLDYLIRYPYGCIEQTTSSVFPQLALKSLFNGDDKRQKEIDENINAGIARLRMFQLSDGSFSYWPGNNNTSIWGTNYASQFLIEARKKGYVVPNGMYDELIRYLERASRNGKKDEKYLMTRVNRCYVLALANKAPISEMNVLKQNYYSKMSGVQKWQLVTAYKLAGAFDKVESLVDNISMEVQDYSELGFTYGSTHRDLGIILRCLTLLERDEDAALMAKKIAEVLSGRRWFSTQSLGQMLLGIGNYFEYAGIQATDDLIIEGQVILPNGERVAIKSVDTYKQYINEGYGKELSLSLNADVNVKQLYATLSANGVPMTDKTETKNNNISMEIDWYNEDGENIDIDDVQQGTTFYGHYSVKNTSVLPVIDEVALVQLLPSGWEIENMRLSNQLLPSWMESWNTGREEYLDIRDDRIMWFFDLSKQEYDFVVKINAIATGKYTLPGARCEAMYSADFYATKAAKEVMVSKE